MSSSLFVPLLLALVGTAALIVLALPLLNAMRGLFGESSGSGAAWNPLSRLRGYRAQKLANTIHSGIGEVDQLLQSRRTPEALTMLGSLFEQTGGQPPLEFVEVTMNLQLSMLARLITVADGASVHVPNIAVVEELIQDRAQLMQAMHDNHKMTRTLKRKRADEKKSLPEWAEQELDNQRQQLQEKLRTNSATLRKQFSEAIATLREQAHRARLTVH